MSVLPKPERRAPSPRRRIVRRVGKAKRSRTPKGLSAWREKRDEADRMWSLIVRSRNPVCQWQGCFRPGAQAHHLVSRKRYQTRWLLDNGSALCAGHHMHVTHLSYENERLAISLLGSREEWERLILLAESHGRPDIDLVLLGLDFSMPKGE